MCGRSESSVASRGITRVETTSCAAAPGGISNATVASERESTGSAGGVVAKRTPKRVVDSRLVPSGV